MRNISKKYSYSLFYRKNLGWTYDIYTKCNNTHVHFFQSTEPFEAMRRAEYAAIGHITLLEKNEQTFNICKG